MPKKIYTGKVISDRMDKTVVVAVTRLAQHSTYKKTIKKTTKFKAHDEGNSCNVGDMVTIVESSPISRDKRWKVLEVVRKASS
jgi:small subunit ribosomal protein S17